MAVSLSFAACTAGQSQPGLSPMAEAEMGDNGAQPGDSATSSPDAGAETGDATTGAMDAAAENLPPVARILSPDTEREYDVAEVIDFRAACEDPEGTGASEHRWTFDGLRDDANSPDVIGVPAHSEGVFEVRYECRDADGVWSVDAARVQVRVSPLAWLNYRYTRGAQNLHFAARADQLHDPKRLTPHSELQWTGTFSQLTYSPDERWVAYVNNLQGVGGAPVAGGPAFGAPGPVSSSQVMLLRTSEAAPVPLPLNVSASLRFSHDNRWLFVAGWRELYAVDLTSQPPAIHLLSELDFGLQGVADIWSLEDGSLLYRSAAGELVHWGPGRPAATPLSDVGRVRSAAARPGLKQFVFRVDDPSDRAGNDDPFLSRDQRILATQSGDPLRWAQVPGLKIEAGPAPYHGKLVAAERAVVVFGTHEGEPGVFAVDWDTLAVTTLASGPHEWLATCGDVLAMSMYDDPTEQLLLQTIGLDGASQHLNTGLLRTRSLAFSEDCARLLYAGDDEVRQLSIARAPSLGIERTAVVATPPSEPNPNPFPFPFAAHGKLDRVSASGQLVHVEGNILDFRGEPRIVMAVPEGARQVRFTPDDSVLWQRAGADDPSPYLERLQFEGEAIDREVLDLGGAPPSDWILGPTGSRVFVASARRSSAAHGQHETLLEYELGERRYRGHEHPLISLDGRAGPSDATVARRMTMITGFQSDGTLGAFAVDSRGRGTVTTLGGVSERDATGSPRWFDEGRALLWHSPQLPQFVFVRPDLGAAVSPARLLHGPDEVAQSFMPRGGWVTHSSWQGDWIVDSEGRVARYSPPVGPGRLVRSVRGATDLDLLIVERRPEDWDAPGSGVGYALLPDLNDVVWLGSSGLTVEYLVAPGGNAIVHWDRADVGASPLRTVLDLATGRARELTRDPDLDALQFSRDGRFVLLGGAGRKHGSDREMVLFGAVVERDQPPVRLAEVGPYPLLYALDQSGERLWYMQDRAMYLLETASPQDARYIAGFARWPDLMQLAPGARALLVSGQGEAGRESQLLTPTGQAIKTLPVGATDFEFSPRGTHLLFSLEEQPFVTTTTTDAAEVPLHAPDLPAGARVDDVQWLPARDLAGDPPPPPPLPPGDGPTFF